MRAFVAIYVRTFSLRYVASHDLEGKVAHGTIDKFIHGSEPQYTTRQLLRKLYLRERLKDLHTDPDPEVVAIYLIHLLNRIPDEHRRSRYMKLVQALKHGHVEVGADVPPWLDPLEELYEDDGPPPPAPPPSPPPPTSLGPGDEPAPYRKPRKKDD